MDPVLGAAAISGGAGLLGNVLGFISNNRTNENNMRINQMNNEFNAKQAEINRNWMQSEWSRQFNLTNEYNTAAAQRQRLEAAGLNPYMMLNGGSAGSAVSHSTPAGAQASAAPPLSMGAYRPDTSFLGMLGNILAQREVTNNQAKNLQGQYNLADAQANYYLSHTDWTKMTKEARAALQSQGVRRAEIGISTEQQTLDNLKTQGDAMRAEMSLKLAQAEAQQVMNKYLDNQQRAELAMKTQLAFQASTQGRLNVQQMRTEIAKQILIYAQANGQRISNEVARNTADALIRATNASNEYYSGYHTQARRYVRGKAATDYLGGYYDYRNKRQQYEYGPLYNQANNFFNGIGNLIGNGRGFRGGRMSTPPRPTLRPILPPVPFN